MAFLVTSSNSANTGSGWIDPGSVNNAAQLTGHAYSLVVAGSPGSLTYTIADTTASTTVVAATPFVAGAAITVDGQTFTIAGTPNAGDSFQLQPAGQQSVFQTIDDAIAALERPAADAQFHEQLARAQVTLDQALDTMILMRSQVGEEIGQLEAATSAMADETLSSRTRLSGLQDLDFASALSDQQLNQTALEAALKSYASVSRTSLFQLMG